MELWDFQKEAVAFVGSAKKAYLAMGLGTGKTLTSLAAATSVSDENILIVAELNEVENSQNFRREVETHFPDWRFFNLRDTGLSEIPPKKAICIANVDLLKKLRLI
jgi:superfamily II DNA or RNA helicase